MKRERERGEVYELVPYLNVVSHHYMYSCVCLFNNNNNNILTYMSVCPSTISPCVC